MERLSRDVSVAFVGIAVLVLTARPVAAQTVAASRTSDRIQARVVNGTISGTVIDEGGGGLRGAMVSALGATLASTVTDERGQFTLNELPVGEYLLRAHLLGFTASSGSIVRVSGGTAVQRVQLQRIAAAVATSGTADAPVKTRPIIAAGFNLPPGPGDDAAPATENHPHDDAAWRLRHIKRSILKEAAPILVLTDENVVVPAGSLFGRAMGSAASLASSLFTDFPFSGEVNFLTTGAVAPGALLSATALPRGVAYLALAAPGAGGDWTIRAAMSEGDLSSWIVAGALASKPGGTHTYNVGLSYSTQEYLGGNPAALAAVTDGSRNAGELYAFDRWALSRAVVVDYGARYANYDYLKARGMISPRFGVTLEPFRDTRVRAAVAQRMVAPGAEEFLGASSAGPWLPPERTFSPLGTPGDAGSFRAERSRSYNVGLERQFSDSVVLSVRRFHESVDDQLVTIFGLSMPGGPRSVGHYYVASAGAVDADGWAVGWNTAEEARMKGSIEYSVTRARWGGRAGGDLLRGLAPAAIRPDTEDLHDVTASFRADVRETATRVFLLYKVNSGLAGPATRPAQSGLGVRFGFQVNQAIPVAFAGTKWEVLVGVRNLFRDPTDPASVYDELLVIRPPKRLIGGFLVRF